MRLSPAPDLSSKRRIAATAVVVTLVVTILLLMFRGAWEAGQFHVMSKLVRTLGDTDDATRLVRVRELLAGRGWYDQTLWRLNPPAGLYMHWSRLLDGALAGLIWLFSRFTAPASAELAARFVWPLLWIGPVVASALVVARNLGGRLAVMAAAIVLTIQLTLYRQFLPGRVDHHNVQIAMTMIALACATTRGTSARLAAAAGLATGFGLAIGLEALPFHALIGASYGLRLVADRKQAGAARAYGLALAGSATLFFLVQTPPWRWALAQCDALAPNILAALVLSGAGLAAVASIPARLSPLARGALIGAAAAVAAAVCLALEPACLYGPFPDLPPRLHAIWLDKVGELRPWPRTLAHDRTSAIQSMTLYVTGLGAALVLALRAGALALRGGGRPDPGALLALACVAAAAAAGFGAMQWDDYAGWFGAPALAAAFSLFAERALKGLLVPTVAVAVLLPPLVLGSALAGGVDLGWPPPVKTRTAELEAANQSACTDAAPYRRLATLPPGLVLADVDFGPFIVSQTPHSAVAAPYRMWRTILAAHDALAAPPARAEAAVRRLGAAYVLDCPAYPAEPAGLVADLRRGAVPPWLTRLSAPGETLQVWRVTRRAR